METAVNPTNGTVTPWSEEREELLRKLWTDGLSCSQIAGQFGDISRNAVIGKVHRLGLESRKRKPKTILSRAEKARRQAERRAHNLAERLLYRTKDGRLPPLKIVETIPAAPFLGVPLLDLEWRQCRFPRGDGANITFCGQPTEIGQSFCPSCFGIVYRKREAA